MSATIFLAEALAEAPQQIRLNIFRKIALTMDLLNSRMTPDQVQEYALDLDVLAGSPIGSEILVLLFSGIAGRDRDDDVVEMMEKVRDSLGN